METKKCNECRQLKSHKEFYKLYKDKNLISPKCKECADRRYKVYAQRVKTSPASIIRTSKVCKLCWNEKPISQFGVQNAKPDKLMSYCKSCWLVYVNDAKDRAKRRKSF